MKQTAKNNLEENQVKVDELSSSEMGLFDHLTELRQRLIKSLLAVSVGFIVSFFFSEYLFSFLSRPLLEILPEADRKLVFTNLPELFFVYIKVSLFAGILTASPVVFYQIWKFVAPGLYRHERRLLFPFVLISSSFFIGGVLFSYYALFPLAFKFFIGLGNEQVQPMITVKDYLKFATTMMLVFGVVFEMPVIAAFMSRLGILNTQILKKHRKYAIIIIFVIAAILTPPDVVSQMMLAVPMLVLYEISIWFAAIFKKPAASD